MGRAGDVGVLLRAVSGCMRPSVCLRSSSIDIRCRRTTLREACRITVRCTGGPVPLASDSVDNVKANSLALDKCRTRSSKTDHHMMGAPSRFFLAAVFMLLVTSWPLFWLGRSSLQSSPCSFLRGFSRGRENDRLSADASHGSSETTTERGIGEDLKSAASGPTFAVGVPLIPRDLYDSRLRDLLYDSVVSQEVPPDEFVVFFSGKEVVSSAGDIGAGGEGERKSTVDLKGLLTAAAREAGAVWDGAGTADHLGLATTSPWDCRTEYNATTADRRVKNVEIEACQGQVAIPSSTITSTIKIILLHAKRVNDKPLERSFSPGVGRNWIAREAKADYVAYLDSDDFAFPDRIKWLRKAAVSAASPLLIAARWSFPVVRVVLRKEKESGTVSRLVYDPSCHGPCNGFGPQLRKFVRSVSVDAPNLRPSLVGHFVGDVRAARRYPEARWKDLTLARLSVECGTNAVESDSATRSRPRSIELKDGMKPDPQLAQLLSSARVPPLIEGRDCAYFPGEDRHRSSQQEQHNMIFLRLSGHIVERHRERGRWYLEWFPFGHITVKRSAALRMPYTEVPKYGAQKGEDQLFISRILMSNEKVVEINHRMVFLENWPLTAKYLGRRASRGRGAGSRTQRSLSESESSTSIALVPGSSWLSSSKYRRNTASTCTLGVREASASLPAWHLILTFSPPVLIGLFLCFQVATGSGDGATFARTTTAATTIAACLRFAASAHQAKFSDATPGAGLAVFLLAGGFGDERWVLALAAFVILLLTAPALVDDAGDAKTSSGGSFASRPEDAATLAVVTLLGIVSLRRKEVLECCSFHRGGREQDDGASVSAAFWKFRSCDDVATAGGAGGKTVLGQEEEAKKKTSDVSGGKLDAVLPTALSTTHAVSPAAVNSPASSPPAALPAGVRASQTHALFDAVTAFLACGTYHVWLNVSVAGVANDFLRISLLFVLLAGCAAFFHGVATAKMLKHGISTSSPTSTVTSCADCILLAQSLAVLGVWMITGVYGPRSVGIFFFAFQLHASGRDLGIRTSTSLVAILFLLIVGDYACLPGLVSLNLLGLFGVNVPAAALDAVFAEGEVASGLIAVFCTFGAADRRGDSTSEARPRQSIADRLRTISKDLERGEPSAAKSGGGRASVKKLDSRTRKSLRNGEVAGGDKDNQPTLLKGDDAIVDEGGSGTHKHQNKDPAAALPDLRHIMSLKSISSSSGAAANAASAAGAFSTSSGSRSTSNGNSKKGKASTLEVKTEAAGGADQHDDLPGTRGRIGVLAFSTDDPDSPVEEARTPTDTQVIVVGERRLNNPDSELQLQLQAQNAHKEMQTSTSPTAGAPSLVVVPGEEENEKPEGARSGLVETAVALSKAEKKPAALANTSGNDSGGSSAGATAATTATTEPASAPASAESPQQQRRRSIEEAWETLQRKRPSAIITDESQLKQQRRKSLRKSNSSGAISPRGEGNSAESSKTVVHEGGTAGAGSSAEGTASVTRKALGASPRGGGSGITTHLQGDGVGGSAAGSAGAAAKPNGPFGTAGGGHGIFSKKQTVEGTPFQQKRSNNLLNPSEFKRPRAKSFSGGLPGLAPGMALSLNPVDGSLVVAGGGQNGSSGSGAGASSSRKSSILQAGGVGQGPVVDVTAPDILAKDEEPDENKPIAPNALHEALLWNQIRKGSVLGAPIDLERFNELQEWSARNSPNVAASIAASIAASPFESRVMSPSRSAHATPPDQEGAPAVNTLTLGQGMASDRNELSDAEAMRLEGRDMEGGVVGTSVALGEGGVGAAAEDGTTTTSSSGGGRNSLGAGDGTTAGASSAGVNVGNGTTTALVAGGASIAPSPRASTSGGLPLMNFEQQPASNSNGAVTGTIASLGGSPEGKKKNALAVQFGEAEVRSRKPSSASIAGVAQPVRPGNVCTSLASSAQSSAAVSMYPSAGNSMHGSRRQSQYTPAKSPNRATLRRTDTAEVSALGAGLLLLDGMKEEGDSSNEDSDEDSSEEDSDEDSDEEEESSDDVVAGGAANNSGAPAAGVKQISPTTSGAGGTGTAAPTGAAAIGATPRGTPDVVDASSKSSTDDATLAAQLGALSFEVNAGTNMAPRASSGNISDLHKPAGVAAASSSSPSATAAAIKTTTTTGTGSSGSSSSSSAPGAEGASVAPVPIIRHNDHRLSLMIPSTVTTLLQGASDNEDASPVSDGGGGGGSRGRSTSGKASDGGGGGGKKEGEEGCLKKTHDQAASSTSSASAETTPNAAATGTGNSDGGAVEGSPILGVEAPSSSSPKAKDSPSAAVAAAAGEVVAVQQLPEQLVQGGSQPTSPTTTTSSTKKKKPKKHIAQLQTQKSLDDSLDINQLLSSCPNVSIADIATTNKALGNMSLMELLTHVQENAALPGLNNFPLMMVQTPMMAAGAGGPSMLNNAGPGGGPASMMVQTPGGSGSVTAGMVGGMLGGGPHGGGGNSGGAVSFLNPAGLDQSALRRPSYDTAMMRGRVMSAGIPFRKCNCKGNVHTCMSPMTSEVQSMINTPLWGRSLHQSQVASISQSRDGSSGESEEEEDEDGGYAYYGGIHVGAGGAAGEREGDIGEIAAREPAGSSKSGGSRSQRGSLKKKMKGGKNGSPKYKYTVQYNTGLNFSNPSVVPEEDSSPTSSVEEHRMAVMDQSAGLAHGSIGNINLNQPNSASESSSATSSPNSSKTLQDLLICPEVEPEQQPRPVTDTVTKKVLKKQRSKFKRIQKSAMRATSPIPEESESYQTSPQDSRRGSHVLGVTTVGIGIGGGHAGLAVAPPGEAIPEEPGDHLPGSSTGSPIMGAASALGALSQMIPTGMGDGRKGQSPTEGQSPVGINSSTPTAVTKTVSSGGSTTFNIGDNLIESSGPLHNPFQTQHVITSSSTAASASASHASTKKKKKRPPPAGAASGATTGLLLGGATTSTGASTSASPSGKKMMNNYASSSIPFPVVDTAHSSKQVLKSGDEEEDEDGIIGRHQMDSPGGPTKNNFEQLTHEELAGLIEKKEPGLLVIDVRGRDFCGGNVPGARNMRTRAIQDDPESLIDDLMKGGVQHVVFTCMYSVLRAITVAGCLSQCMAENPRNRSFKMSILKEGFHGWFNYWIRKEDEENLGSQNMIEKWVANYDVTKWVEQEGTGGGKTFVHVMDAVWSDKGHQLLVNALQEIAADRERW